MSPRSTLGLAAWLTAGAVSLGLGAAALSRRSRGRPEAIAAPSRRVPSEAERRIAARIRVRTDRALGVDTPQWIRDLAEASDQNQRGGGSPAVSGLQRRIAEGTAEPISSLEREQLKHLRDVYARRFGKMPGGPVIGGSPARLES